MTRVRTIGVALGFLVLMGVGAVTLSRGQPPASDAPRGSSPDVATLEAEVELLQIEHEVARENLRDFLKKCEHLQTVKELGLFSSSELATEVTKIYFGKDVAESESSAIAHAVALLGEDAKEVKEAEEADAKDVKRAFDLLRSARERIEQDFVNRTKTFNARTQALADARRKDRDARRKDREETR